MKILVLNAGSSSQKSCLYDLEHIPDLSPLPLWQGQIDWVGEKAELKVKTPDTTVKLAFKSDSRGADTLKMLETLWSGDNRVLSSPKEIDAVGHRVVHGGWQYRQSVRIDEEVKAAIANLSKFAPVHNPINLEGIETMEHILPDIPQIAMFDTAFHSQIPASAYTYPIPYELCQQGIRRYGFHGISHQYCAQRSAEILGRNLEELRLITCHLGNGCSLAAIRNGYSIDTTMGFTPLEGLMMGNRAGSIDPGIIIYLLKDKGYNPATIDTLLNQESGLLGVSGVSHDLREIKKAIAVGNERAKLALEIYQHRLSAAIAAMLPALGGLDVLVFTAGVGENNPELRANVAASLGFLGVKIDDSLNMSQKMDVDIALPDSTARVLVIHTQEDWAIAQACWQLLNHPDR